jgi:radical SAM protein with 4Fe4S-binding SPASM domain
MDNFHVQWHITDACNLRCRHCYQEGFDKSRDLGWKDLKKISDNLIEAMKAWGKKLTLSLTGGEPFLKEELWQVIDYLSGSDHVAGLNIITNGTLMAGFIPQLKDSPKLRHIYVSLEGAGPTANDAIRGQGNFDMALNNIKLLRQNNLAVFIMFTLMKSNIPEAKKLLSFCRANNLQGYFIERFIPLGQSRSRTKEMVSPFDMDKVYKEIFDQYGLDYYQSGVSPLAIKAELEAKPAELFASECIVAKDGCAIMPKGDVLPCRRFNLSIGNLIEDSLVDIWKDSPVLGAIRKKEADIKDHISCKALSYSLCGDYLLDDSLCWMDKAKVE